MEIPKPAFLEVNMHFVYFPLLLQVLMSGEIPTHWAGYIEKVNYLQIVSFKHLFRCTLGIPKKGHNRKFPLLAA